MSPVAAIEDAVQGSLASPCPRLVATPSPVSTAGPSSGEVDLARGRWRSMARAPFGIDTELAVWTGSRMIVTQWDTGRTASYDPRNDRWREVAQAPRGLGSVARSVWTGDELIIIEVDDDGPGLDGIAYDPVEDRWRTIQPHPAAIDLQDHAIGRPIWTGTHVVVLDARGNLSAYHPGMDCWAEVPPVPGDDASWGLYQVGRRLLVESRDRTEGVVSMRNFDPATGMWSVPIPGPLDVEAVREGGSVIDDRIVYVSWAETQNDDGLGAWDAVFDPTRMSWSTFVHDCETNASETTAQAGDLLIANDGRRALDGRTLSCIDLPSSPRRFNGTEVVVWTGSELIVWSGYTESVPARRGGSVLAVAG